MYFINKQDCPALKQLQLILSYLDGLLDVCDAGGGGRQGGEPGVVGLLTSQGYDPG